MTICPYFRKCNGCDLQHLDYQQQLEKKKKEVSKLLFSENNQITETKVISPEEIQVFSDAPFHYRNRMDFLFHPHGVGLRETKFKVIEIKECLIAMDSINQALTELNHYFPKYL